MAREIPIYDPLAEKAPQGIRLPGGCLVTPSSCANQGTLRFLARSAGSRLGKYDSVGGVAAVLPWPKSVDDAGDLLYAGSNPFNFLQVTNYAVHVMNDSPEEEEDDETDGILIAEGDDWPEDYYDGFDAPMKVISEILLDSEAWDLPISWPEVLSGWRDARKLLDCLESIKSSCSAYNLFDAIDGCSVDSESWGGDSPGRSGCWISVFVRPEKLDQALETVVRLSDALRSYWISSGKAAAAGQCWRDYKAKKENR